MKSITYILVAVMTVYAAVVNAADCTTKKEISIPSFSTPSGETPSKVTIDIPSSLASVLDISVNKGDASDAWKTTGSILIDSSLFSNLGASMTYDTTTKTVKVTVGNNVGSNAMKMYGNDNDNNMLTGLLTSMITCSYLTSDNYKNTITLSATAVSIYGLLSMNTAYAQSSTSSSCTQSGTIAVYMPVGWEAKVSDESNSANGKFVYTISQTLSPTKRPTPPTTPAPTKAPTKTPTKSPSVSPTKSPSKAPTTPNPTNAPSASPSKSPSKSPSVSPTKTPSRSPTASPTNKPTTSPTIPFIAVFSELAIACDPPGAEIILHSSIDPNDVELYVYVRPSPTTSPTSQVSFKFKSNVNSWTPAPTQSPTCTAIKVYSTTFAPTAFFTISGGLPDARIGFGIAYKGAKTTFTKFNVASAVNAIDGLFAGDSATSTLGASGINRYYLNAVTNGKNGRNTLSGYNYDHDGVCDNVNLGTIESAIVSTFC